MINRGFVEAPRSRKPDSGQILILALLASFAAVTIHYVGASYLTADEATFFSSIEAHSWRAAYTAAREHPHPPLWPLLLHAVGKLGTSELALRLPAVLGSVFGIWFTFRWLMLLAGESAAICGAGFLLGSTAMLSMATETRPYPALYFFESAALWAAEIVLRSGSRRALAGLTLALVGSMLSHFSTIFVAVALAVRLGPPLLRSPRFKPLRTAWLGGQVVIAAVGLWGFFVHDRLFTGAMLEESGKALWWVQGGYWQDGPLWQFLLKVPTRVFRYFTGSTPVAYLSLGLFALGVWRLHRDEPETGESQRWAVDALLLLPFGLCLTMAAAGLYPAGATRHVTYLLPFAAAGIGAGAAWLFGERKAFVFAAAILLTTGNLAGNRPANDPRLYSPEDLRQALAYLDANVPRGRILLTDGQSVPAFRYYLRDRERSVRHVRMFEIDGFLFAPVEPWIWVLTPKYLQPRTGRTARQLGYRDGDDIWVISSGWGYPGPLSRGIPARQLLSYREFGRIRFLHMQLARREK